MVCESEWLNLPYVQLREKPESYRFLGVIDLSSFIGLCQPEQHDEPGGISGNPYLSRPQRCLQAIADAPRVNSLLGGVANFCFNAGSLTAMNHQGYGPESAVCRSNQVSMTSLETARSEKFRTVRRFDITSYVCSAIPSSAPLARMAGELRTSGIKCTESLVLRFELSLVTEVGN